MAKDIEIFRKCCLDLLKLTEIRETINPEEFFSISIHEDRCLYYKPEYRTKINKLVDRLIEKREGFASNCSRDYLLQTINDFLFNLKFDKDPQKSIVIDRFFNSQLFKENTIFDVTRQIVNLFPDSEFSIGKVTFTPYSREKYESIYRELGKNTDNMDRYLHYKNDESVGCIARVEVSAVDSEKALELSDYLVEESLNVIKVYLTNASFGLRGTLGCLQSFATIYDTKTENLSSPMKNKDLNVPFILKLNWIEYFKNNHGLTNIDNILKKENKTDMEENLIISITFLSKILKHTNDPENIARLFTSMEALLIENEEKACNLAKRLAVINYLDESKRNELYNLVIKMYKERNKLVHEGLTKNGLPNFNGNELSKLFMESRSCIINISKMIDKYEKLSDWKTDWEKLIKEANFSVVPKSNGKP